MEPGEHSASLGRPRASPYAVAAETAEWAAPDDEVRCIECHDVYVLAAAGDADTHACPYCGCASWIAAVIPPPPTALGERASAYLRR